MSEIKVAMSHAKFLKGFIARLNVKWKASSGLGHHVDFVNDNFHIPSCHFAVDLTIWSLSHCAFNANSRFQGKGFVALNVFFNRIAIVRKDNLHDAQSISEHNKLLVHPRVLNPSG